MIERAARPLAGLWNGIANVMRAFYRVLGTPGKYLQDFANGSWLGHALHAVLVDVVIGAATAAVLLDVLRIFFAADGLEDATTWTLGLATLAGIAAVLTGLTDFKDTGPGDLRNTVGLHGLINIIGLIGWIPSLVQRLNGNIDGGFWPLVIGYVIVSIGSYIGGHNVFKYGYMVNFNAFNRERAKDFTAVMPSAELVEGSPTRATLGTTRLLLVRRGDMVNALLETCSHLGGPLSKGTLEGDGIVCPWHFSKFRLSDGAVLHGPAGTRLPTFSARIRAGQVEVQGPRD
jgi:nitrite reductase/ring-hydroxylating ferredoxin subunit/uncharacterized membrane protein